VVADYTSTGVPVGSQTLAARYLVELSPATIRHELNTLVEDGYLLQPHPSAGRVPSDLGYRFFVDTLMDRKRLPASVARKIATNLAEAPDDMEAVLEEAAATLSEASGQATVVTAPRTARAVLKHVELIQLEPTAVLMVIVLEGNVVRQTMARLDQPADSKALEKVAATLNALRGQGAAVIERAVSGTDLPEPAPQMLRRLGQTLSAYDLSGDELIVHDGLRNILRQPEFADSTRAQPLVEVLEQSTLLSRVLSGVQDQGLNVFIGTENAWEQLHFCSIVLGSYAVNPERRGTIGIIGPTRMDYAAAIALIRFVADKLAETLQRVCA
jgi:heat-inducible transcriptional repressor